MGSAVMLSSLGLVCVCLIVCVSGEDDMVDHLDHGEDDMADHMDHIHHHKSKHQDHVHQHKHHEDKTSFGIINVEQHHNKIHDHKYFEDLSVTDESINANYYDVIPEKYDEVRLGSQGQDRQDHEHHHQLLEHNDHKDNKHSHDDRHHHQHEYNDHGHRHEEKENTLSLKLGSLSNLSSTTWLASFSSIAVISIVGLLTVGIIPLLKGPHQESALQLLVSLAVGTLVGDALIHLLPHALDMDHGDTSVIWKGFTATMTIICFFIMDRVLEGLGHGHSHGPLGLGGHHSDAGSGTDVENLTVNGSDRASRESSPISKVTIVFHSFYASFTGYFLRID